jgi:ATPase subunit of ABC transporter with duplicated ATPase domains
MTVLTVTHDRAFLEEVCHTILEVTCLILHRVNLKAIESNVFDSSSRQLDRGQFYTYPGSYAAYLQGKEERWAVEDQQFKDAKKQYKREREWRALRREQMRFDSACFFLESETDILRPHPFAVAWMRKQPQGRQTKQNARVSATSNVTP